MIFRPDGPPGVPLDSGFVNWRRAAQLSPEARQRVDDKIRSVEEARRRAMETWHEYVMA